MTAAEIIIGIGLWGLMIGIWTLFVYTVWHDLKEARKLDEWFRR